MNPLLEMDEEMELEEELEEDAELVVEIETKDEEKDGEVELVYDGRDGLLSDIARLVRWWFKDGSGQTSGAAWIDTRARGSGPKNRG